jgi:hypothetical protein
VRREVRALDDRVDRVGARRCDVGADGGDVRVAGGALFDLLDALGVTFDQQRAPVLLRPQRVGVREVDAVAGADFEAGLGRRRQQRQEVVDDAVFAALGGDVAAVAVERIGHRELGGSWSRGSTIT